MHDCCTSTVCPERRAKLPASNGSIQWRTVKLFLIIHIPHLDGQMICFMYIDINIDIDISSSTKNCVRCVLLVSCVLISVGRVLPL